MIKKLVVPNLLAAGVLVAGCGKSTAVKATEDLADAVCACRDTNCAVETLKKGRESVMATVDAKGTQSDVEAMKAAWDKIQGCVQSLGKK
jgi:hypothetical protein